MMRNVRDCVCGALVAAVSLATFGALGDVTLGPGETLTGLTDCTLSHNIGGGMKVKLVRTGDALLLRALPGGITVIFRYDWQKAA